MIRKIISVIFNIILPPRCFITGKVVLQDGTLNNEIWNKIRFIQKPYCEKCGFPFEFEIEEYKTNGQILCNRCLLKMPLYNKSRSVFIYNENSSQIIWDFKFNDKEYFAKYLSKLAFASIDGKIFAKIDFIIPVPLHKNRLRKRRYNQSALLGKELSKLANIGHIPDFLIRIRDTVPQYSIPQEERAKNVKNAFVINPKYTEMVAGKNFIIIDDIITTGSTINECVKILKKSKAGIVNILTIGKT